MDINDRRRWNRRRIMIGGMTERFGYVALEESGTITFIWQRSGPIQLTEQEGIISITEGATEAAGVVDLGGPKTYSAQKINELLGII